jgi:hypothetical protein
MFDSSCRVSCSIRVLHILPNAEDNAKVPSKERGCRAALHNQAANTIHLLFDSTFDLVPVGSSLSIFVHFFRSEYAFVLVRVGNDSGDFLCLFSVDEVDLRQFAQCGEVLHQWLVAQGDDIYVVCVHVAAKCEHVSSI